MLISCWMLVGIGKSMDTRADLIGMSRVLAHHRPALEGGRCGNREERFDCLLFDG